jgi:hypothetical protein
LRRSVTGNRVADMYASEIGGHSHEPEGTLADIWS